MLFSKILRGQHWPLPVAQDADLRTRLTAALHSLEQGIAVVRSLQTTIIWSMWMVQDPDASETDQLAALDRLAQYLARRWEVHDQRVRAELKWRMNETGASWMTVKGEVLKTAWWLVLRGDSNEPQTVRFTPEGWLVDDVGHKVSIVPDDLPFPITFRWAKNQVIKTAIAILLEQSEAGHETARAQPGTCSLDDPHAVPLETRDLDADADPLYAILERETATDDAARYAALWQRATPAERRLLVALLAQLKAGGSMTDGAIKAAAESLGISAGTARAQLYRLRAKLATVTTAAITDNVADPSV